MNYLHDIVAESGSQLAYEELESLKAEIARLTRELAESQTWGEQWRDRHASTDAALHKALDEVRRLTREVERLAADARIEKRAAMDRYDEVERLRGLLQRVRYDPKGQEKLAEEVAAALSASEAARGGR